MAIKIIRSGTKQKVECNECGALLRYDLSDVQSKFSDNSAYNKDSDTFSGIEKYIICPACQEKIVLLASRGD